METIPVIDLFAGPGGLGEGFSAFKVKKKNPFKVALSIEKDSLAHKTLELRSFFRKFAPSKIPSEYYDYLKGLITRKELFEKYPREANLASVDAWNAELGVTPHKDVIARIKRALKHSSRWILIGGPPCQAYSIMGRIKIKALSPKKFEKDHRHFLYKEYLRILREKKPPVFVMENVLGMLSSKMKGRYIFDNIIEDLRCPSNAFGDRKKKVEYKIYSLSKQVNGEACDKKNYIIKCEDYGIPQRRHRVILLGVRSDLKVMPGLLKKSSKKLSMWDVLADMPKLRSGFSILRHDNMKRWSDAILKIRNYVWFKSKRTISDKLIAHMKLKLLHLKSDLNYGGEYVTNQNSPSYQKTWFCDAKLQGVCNHSSRKHMEKDLQRYFFAACFAKIYKRSPEIKNFPRELWPKHKNVKEASKGQMFADRFRVQVKGKPSTTVTCHISKDGHYFIHPDPCQCRSLTVREAARLQTFPDNYLFVGTRTSQYAQVGNAVPPLLAKKIAHIIFNIFKIIT